MTRVSWIVLIAFGLIVVGAGGLFLLFFESVKVKVERGPSGPAVVNPILAAERLLTEMKVSVESGNARLVSQALQDPGSTLVLMAGGAGLGGDRVDRILEWIEAGGRLVLVYMAGQSTETAMNDEGPPDHLSDWFSVSSYEVEETDPIREIAWDDTTAPTYMANFEKQAFIIYGEEVQFLLGDDNGPRVAVEPYGEGEGVILASGTFMVNSAIGEHDHARLFYDLVAPVERTPTKVYLVYQQEYPTFWRFLVDRAWMSLITLAILLAIGYWAFAPRFGPIATVPLPQRRRLTEHLVASSLFLWRLSKRTPAGETRDQLLTQVRDALMQAVSKRHPTWLSLEPAALYQRLGELAGVDGHGVEALFQSGKAMNEEQFTKAVRLLELIRRKL